jgi:hypothetical protein
MESLIANLMVPNQKKWADSELPTHFYSFTCANEAIGSGQSFSPFFGTIAY